MKELTGSHLRGATTLRLLPFLRGLLHTTSIWVSALCHCCLTFPPFTSQMASFLISNPFSQPAEPSVPHITSPHCRRPTAIRLPMGVRSQLLVGSSWAAMSRDYFHSGRCVSTMAGVWADDGDTLSQDRRKNKTVSFQLIHGTE